MKKYVIPTILAFVFMGVSLTGCARKEEPAQTKAAETVSVKGMIEGKTYKNDYFKLEYTVPDDWKLYNAADGSDRKYIEKIAGNSSSDKAFIDMYAQKGDSNVSVTVYKADAIGGFSVTNDFLVDDIVRSLQSDPSKTGLEDPVIEKTRIIFAGKEVSAVRQTGKYNGSGIVSTQYLFPKDSYVCCVTVTCAGPDFSQSIFSLFNELK